MSRRILVPLDGSPFSERALTLAWCPVQFGILCWLLWYVPRAAHLSGWEQAGVFFGMGVLSGKYQDGARPSGARFTAYEQGSPRSRAMTRRFVNERTLASTARFADIAAQAGLAPVTLAVAWSLAHDFVGATIIGATSADQLGDTLPAADVTLSDDVLAACNEVSREIRYPMG